MKTLVTYSTLTGNTRKVGEAIFEIIEGEKDILPIKEVKDLTSYDRVIVGFWVDKGDANQEAQEFMRKLENKTVGIYATIGAYPDSDHASKCMTNVSDRVARNNQVLATFMCQGAIDPKIIERIKQMAALPNNPHPVTTDREKLWADAAKHPDQHDLENARKAFSAFNR